MDLSVLIPTHRRPEAIDRCLSHLASQRCDALFEVIVGLDGDQQDTPRPTIPESLVNKTRLVCPGRVGLPRLRSQMMRGASGRIVLWLNDDAYPQPDLLAAHLQAHLDASTPRVVAGHARWFPVEHPTLFDRLVQESDLVFFQQPPGSAPQPTTYRHCFGLNVSFEREMALEVGGVAEVDEHYGYEDIELAWRLARAGAECVYESRALVEHDHRYRAVDVHRREYLLGRAAWAFAHANPDFAGDLFGRNLREPSVVESFLTAIDLGWRDALRIERSFLSLGDQGPESVDASMLPVLAEHWVLLKRLLWRWGVLDAQHGIASRWSVLRETTPESVLCALQDPV
ncbi:MAG: glycosyltransferase family 2 protein [Phycisphaerales bacterium JB052]